MSDHRSLRKIAVAMCLLGALGAGAVEAHKGATGIVKQRMSAMKDMGAIMKDWAAMRKGRTEFQSSAVQAQAASLKEHAAEMASLFPAGSNKGVSEALPAIWKNWEVFAGVATKLEMLAVKLGGPAGAQKASSIPLMIEIGGTCSSCHKDFRKKSK